MTALEVTPQARILVVEDNDDARIALADLLEMLGFEVATAADGERGVERALELLPDVCLIDVGLPLVDGFEVARRLRGAERGKDLYLIALTGYSTPEHASEAMAAGFNLHLVKPIDPRSLEQILLQGTSLRSSTPAS